MSKRILGVLIEKIAEFVKECLCVISCRRTLYVQSSFVIVAMVLLVSRDS